MARVDADRNLLFGIFALQMDFIGRDALVAAMHAWVLTKQTPLGQVLKEQGALSESRHALLEALVAEHVGQHGGDPARSLAALSAVGSARRDLEGLGDTEVHQSLALVGADCAAKADPFATQHASIGEATAAGTRFLILRPHAKGGAGRGVGGAGYGAEPRGGVQGNPGSIRRP